MLDTGITSSKSCNNCGSDANRPLFEANGYRLVECTGCGLAFIANPPSEEQLAAIYSADTGYHVQLFDPDGQEFRRMAKLGNRHLDILRKTVTSGRLLDVGCSTGLFLDHARQAGFACQGMEFSEGSVAFARSHFGLDVARGSIHDCHEADGSFDAITMFDVIEHVPDPVSDMRKAWRLLRPGGWFVLSTPNIDGLFPRLSYKLAHRLDYWPHPEPPGHLYQFSVRTLTAMLAKTGFEPGRVDQCNIALEYTFGTLATLARMPRRLAYALVFAAFAKAGPLIGQGDWFYIAARKPSTPHRTEVTAPAT